MFPSKMFTMRMGAVSVISSVNRFQLAIDASANGSITNAATYYPRRYQHVLCANTTANSSAINRKYSLLNKRYTNVSILSNAESMLV